MIPFDEVGQVAEFLWREQSRQSWRWHRIAEFYAGRFGVPQVTGDASDELRDLAKLAVKNVFPLIIQSFVANLAVADFSSASPGSLAGVRAGWKAERMHRRQHEIHTTAMQFGHAYAVVLPGDPHRGEKPSDRQVHLKSPRQAIAAYRDIDRDQWPVYGLTTWVDRAQTSGRPHVYGYLLDDTHVWQLDLGEYAHDLGTGMRPFNLSEVAAPFEHHADTGAPPIVRYVNGISPDDGPTSEVEPLITEQKALNEVNYDRLSVSRFGAYPQKWSIGYSQADPSERMKMAVSRMLTVDSPDAKLGAFPAADVGPYNEVLEEMEQHIALTAAISPAKLTGNMVQLSAEALAAADKAEQRKTRLKQDLFGEAHVALARLITPTAPEDLAVVWAHTEAQAFGAAVDGVTKLAAQGAPLGPLLPLIPGMTEDMVTKITQVLETVATARTKLPLPEQKRETGG